MFSDAEMRRLFLHSMPNAWQDKFEDASKTTHNTTLHEIQDYMQRQSEKDPYKPNSKGKNNNINGNNNGRGNGRGGRSQGRGGRGRKNGRGGRNNNNNNGNNNYPCPLPGHGGHTVAQCYRQQRQQQQNQTPQGRGNAGRGNNPRYNQRNNIPPEVNTADQVPAATSSSMSSNSSTQRVSFNSDLDGHFFDALPTVQSSLNDLDSFLHKDPESFFYASEKGLGWPHYEPKDHFQVSKSLPSLLPSISTDLVPQTIATARKINDQEGRFFFKTLFDSGATPEASILIIKT
jgi:hypothetical protein